LTELPEHALRNREFWTRLNAEYFDRSAEAAWAQEEITWGMFKVPESEVGVLGDVAGLDVLDFGCGTAYFSAWLARRGARVVGLDVTPAQLETARRLQAEFGLDFTLVEAIAEAVPLGDGSFDLVLSELGASKWCEPAAWVPEAARLLRPGGRLVFLCNSTLLILCSPDGGDVGERLVRPQFGMSRFEWERGVESFHLAHGDWIKLLRGSGFEVEDLVELQAPAGAADHPYSDFVSADWARRWPAEEIWVAHRRA
jgi:SAM-dependent methyltransferase